MAAAGQRVHGTITVHSPELCDEIFAPSREDTVRRKVKYAILLLSFLMITSERSRHVRVSDSMATPPIA